MKIEELQQQVEILRRELEEFRDSYNRNRFSSLEIKDKDIKFTAKVGFYNTDPVAQQPAITTPTGGGSGSDDAIDIFARSSIVEIKNALKNLGLTL